MTTAPLATADPPLLLTKLYRPHPRARLVARPRLRALVAAAPLPPLTLIVAPAGFGKTTLLADWLNEVDASVAWLSLDDGDNDPGTFLRYLIAALHVTRPDIGADTLRLLNTHQPPPPETLLVMLVNEMAGLDDPIVLALDDYHLVTNPVVHQALRFLLERRPPCLNLALSSRTDPPLPLVRLRARAQLTEVRAADLRFTHEEAAAFLHDVMGMQVSDDDAHTIEQRTEGWAAGLQLAALALNKRDGRASLTQFFAASNRYIVDYLMEEVIEQMPPHLRTFMLQTSVLDRMCGPLCDALLDMAPQTPPQAERARRVPPADDSYSQLILAQLEQENLFVIPLDDERRWYRYHHLFAEVLRERLTSGASAGVVVELYRRVSRWFAGQGLGREAVKYALESRDWALAASMLEQFGYQVGLRGETATVLGWLRTLPEPVLRTRPFLCVLYFALLSLTHQTAAARHWLEVAEAGLGPHVPPGITRVLRGYIKLGYGQLGRVRGDLTTAIGMAQEALPLLGESDALGYDSARMMVGRAYQLTGDVTAASEQLMIDVLSHTHSQDYIIIPVANIVSLARLQQLQGHLRAASDTLDRVLEIAEPQVLSNIYHGPYYFVCRGDLLREWGRLDEAHEHLARVLGLIHGNVAVEADYVLLAYGAMARLQCARGDSAGALATLDACIAVSLEREFYPLLVEQARAFQAWVHLSRGDLDAALSWAATCALSADDPELPFLREAEYLTLARVVAAYGKASGRDDLVNAALRLLARLLADAELKERRDSEIKIRVTRALAHQDRGDLPAAEADLGRVLHLGELEGYVRSFVDEGPALRRLLTHARARLPEPGLRDYADRLIALFPPEAAPAAPSPLQPAPVAPLARPPALAEPLTTREREVLRLLATGLTNKAIAEQLVMSRHTVNSHLKTIYGKLGVTTRAAATRAALEVGIVSDDSAPEA